MIHQEVHCEFCTSEVQEIQGEWICMACGLCVGYVFLHDPPMVVTVRKPPSIPFIEQVCSIARIPEAVEAKTLWIWEHVQNIYLVKSLHRCHVYLACIAVASNMCDYHISLQNLIICSSFRNVKLRSLHKCIDMVSKTMGYTMKKSLYSVLMFSSLEKMTFFSDLHRRFLWQCARKVLLRLEEFEMDINPTWVVTECIRIFDESLRSSSEPSSQILPSSVLMFLRSIFYSTIQSYPFRKLNEKHLSQEINEERSYGDLGTSSKFNTRQVQ